ncbi:LysR substrate-binding domain-containing protein [Pseudomonas rhizosphaerae]|uniref:LysR substrate-binding domain-containing protein n=1 Tax=Pseudomonas rhizosphaerae TaxID=216142 RepID=UPI002B45AFC0|nr:LysR substrate-binding domain-containing protein [Pseudomonas rhizosphaerae]MEB2871277.1 LysR substrate-binding domain-containing protein [Pseudomonas rhizosphaerae]
MLLRCGEIDCEKVRKPLQIMCFQSIEEKNSAMRADTPLRAIACFDAVMRTGSVNVAASQLFVTPGAVGQQIRKLEAWLGTPLFVRSVRRLQPTAEALSYWEQVKPALRQLETANLAVRGLRDRQVRLSLPPAFANSWFAKRMPLFTKRHPEVQLHLSASTDAVDFNEATCDLAVRHFDGYGGEVDAELLLPDEVRVYCSPTYRERLQLHSLDSLPGATLLYTTSHAHWSQWLSSVGMSIDSFSSGLKFDQSELAIDAARRDQGLVLTSPWLVEEDVQRGLLVPVFDSVLKTGKGYYLVQAKDVVLGEAAQLLRRWLCDVAQRVQQN